MPPAYSCPRNAEGSQLASSPQGEETRTMHRLSAQLLEPNEESVKEAGAVATADFTSP